MDFSSPARGFNKQFGFTSFGRNTLTVPDTPHASWPEIVGDDLLNGQGAFPDAGNWALPTGATIAGGKLNYAAVAAHSGATNGDTPAAAFITLGRYITNFDLSGVLGGECAMSIGDASGASYGGSGTNIVDIIDGMDDLGDGFKILNSSGVAGTFSVDNVTVKTLQMMGQAEGTWDPSGGAGLAGDGGVNTGIILDGATESDIISLIGSAKDAFDAANSTNTACNYTLYITYYGDPTSFGIRARGGSWATVTADGTSPIVVPLTTGSGSGFDVRGTSGGTNPVVIYLVRPALA